MKPAICFSILLATILFLVYPVAPVLASQIANHIRVARLARDHRDTPRDVREFLLRYSDFYEAGAAGPDVIGNVLGSLPGFSTAKNAHYKKTGALIMNMLKVSYRQQDEARGAEYLAYTLGWMTHFFVDVHEHKVINDYGGLFDIDPERHIRLEMLEIAHVYEISEQERAAPYIALAKGIPSDLMREAYQDTYSKPLGEFGPLIRLRAGGARQATEENIGSAAFFMERFTNLTLRQYRAQLEVSALESFRYGEYGLGHIPMREEEYWNILQPVGVRIEKLAGDRKGISAVVKWHISDTTLQVGYLTDWYNTNSLAINAIVAKFRQLPRGGLSLHFPDMNLDTGDLETAGFSKARIISGKFKSIEELELEWKVFGKSGKILHSDKKKIHFGKILAIWETRYVKRKEGTLRISIPAKPALFCRGNQRLEMQVRLRMLNTNTHLMQGPYATSFKFEAGHWSSGVDVDMSRKVPIEASERVILSSDMPGLEDCSAIVERCRFGNTYKPRSYETECVCARIRPGKAGRYSAKWVIQKDDSKCTRTGRSF